MLRIVNRKNFRFALVDDAARFLQSCRYTYMHSNETVPMLQGELGPNETDQTPSPADQRLVEVGVVGVPNAGKSTLINALVGQKISAVSDKTNTTTRSRMGAFTSHQTQVILYDTPGIVGPEHYRNPKHADRVQSAWTVARECNIILFILDAARQLQQSDPRILRLLSKLDAQQPPKRTKSAVNKYKLNKSEDDDDVLSIENEIQGKEKPPAILVLNKIDAIPASNRPLLVNLSSQLQQLASFEEIFCISALKSKGIEELKSYLLSQSQPGQWMVESESSTDASRDEIACEIVREKIFRAYYSDIPYETMLVLDSFKTLVDGSFRIEINVMVPNENTRMIVVGSDGNAIRSVGKAARLELEKMWGKRVHLFLNVKKMK